MKFHDELNPKLWNKQKIENPDGTEEYILKPEVADKLREIANAFIEYMDIDEDAVEDVVITGSSASYNYTPHSDLDLHLKIDYDKIHEDCPIVEGFLWALKATFNKDHDISIYGVPVEVYAESLDQDTVHNGLYSIWLDKWIDLPKKIPPTDNDAAVQSKYEEIKEAADRIEDSEVAEELINKIYEMRKAGLDEVGEFSTENLAFKKLRDNGILDKLKQMKKEKIDKQLSLESYNEAYHVSIQNRPSIQKIQDALNEYKPVFEITKGYDPHLYKFSCSEKDWKEVYNILKKLNCEKLNWTPSLYPDCKGVFKFIYPYDIEEQIDNQLSLESYNEDFFYCKDCQGSTYVGEIAERVCEKWGLKGTSFSLYDNEAFITLYDGRQINLSLDRDTKELTIKVGKNPQNYKRIIVTKESTELDKEVQEVIDIINDLSKKNKAIKEELETKNYNDVEYTLLPDGEYVDIKIYAPEGKVFKNGDTIYTTQSTKDRADDLVKDIIDNEIYESIKESLQDDVQEALNLIEEGMSHLVFDYNYAKFEKKFDKIREMKQPKAQLKRAKDLLLDIQGRLIDEQYDKYNEKVDALIFKKNESIKEDTQSSSKNCNEALQSGEAEILEWLKQRQVKVGYGFNKLSKEGTAYYMAKLINSLDENIINKIKEAHFSNFNTKEFTLENKEALEAPKVVPCNSIITHLVCLYINPETNKIYSEQPTEEETLHRSIKIKMNKLYNKKTGWDRKGYYFLQKNGNKYEIVTNLGKRQYEVVITADSLQELNDILAEKLNKGQNNRKNESIKEDVLPHNIEKVNKLIQRIQNDNYYKIDGDEITVRRGDLSPVLSAMSLQDLAKDFQNLGFKVYVDNFYIDVKGLKDYMNKNESINENNWQRFDSDEDELEQENNRPSRYYYGETRDGVKLLVKGKDSEEVIKKAKAKGYNYFIPDVTYSSVDKCNRTYDKLIESIKEDYQDDCEDVPEEMHKERYVVYFETPEGRQKYTIYHVYTDSTDDSYNELCDKRDNQLDMYNSYKELKDALKEKAEKIAKQQGWTIKSIDNLGEDDEYYRERNKWESIKESENDYIYGKDLQKEHSYIAVRPRLSEYGWGSEDFTEKELQELEPYIAYKSKGNDFCFRLKDNIRLTYKGRYRGYTSIKMLVENTKVILEMNFRDMFKELNKTESIKEDIQKLNLEDFKIEKTDSGVYKVAYDSRIGYIKPDKSYSKVQKALGNAIYKYNTKDIQADRKALINKLHKLFREAGIPKMEDMKSSIRGYRPITKNGYYIDIYSGDRTSFNIGLSNSNDEYFNKIKEILNKEGIEYWQGLDYFSIDMEKQNMKNESLNEDNNMPKQIVNNIKSDAEKIINSFGKSVKRWNYELKIDDNDIIEVAPNNIENKLNKIITDYIEEKDLTSIDLDYEIEYEGSEKYAEVLKDENWELLEFGYLYLPEESVMAIRIGITFDDTLNESLDEKYCTKAEITRFLKSHKATEVAFGRYISEIKGTEKLFEMHAHGSKKIAGTYDSFDLTVYPKGALYREELATGFGKATTKYYIFGVEVEDIDESLNEMNDRTVYNVKQARRDNFRNSGYSREEGIKFGKNDTLYNQRIKSKGLSIEDGIDNLVHIGFDKLSAYKPSVVKAVKEIMARACELGLAEPYDFGKGKGKYRTDNTIEDVIKGLLDDKIAREVAMNYVNKQNKGAGLPLRTDESLKESLDVDTRRLKELMFQYLDDIDYKAPNYYKKQLKVDKEHKDYIDVLTIEIAKDYLKGMDLQAPLQAQFDVEHVLADNFEKWLDEYQAQFNKELVNFIVIGAVPYLRGKLRDANLLYSTEVYTGAKRENDGLLVKVPEDEAAEFEMWLQDQNLKYYDFEQLEENISLARLKKISESLDKFLA